MTFIGVGESIAGEKIYWRFGNYSGPNSKSGKRVGTFGRHGYARVQTPLKRATEIAHRERATIFCLSASYSAVDLSVNAQKVKCGAHTCFEGFLKGDASCTIKIPDPNSAAAPE